MQDQAPSWIRSHNHYTSSLPLRKLNLEEEKLYFSQLILALLLEASFRFARIATSVARWHLESLRSLYQPGKMTNEKSFARWTLESQDGFAGLRFSENHTLRPLGDDDVFVQMHAASLNYRDLVIAKVTDDLLVRHSRNSDLDRSLRIYYMDHPRIILFSAADSPLQGELNLPFRPGVIPGSDGSGVVIEVGKSVIAFEVGDRVCTHMVPSMADNVFPTMSHISAGMGETVDGTMTEYGVFHSSTLIPMPRNLEFGPAATLTCSALTAWNALFGLRGRELKQGDWVLVQGTGGVSMAALQVSKLCGNFGLRIQSTARWVDTK